jgi:cytochrome P450
MSTQQAVVPLDWNPFDTTFIEDPYPFYRRLRNQAPAFWSEKFSLRVLSRFEDVQTAARDWRTYTSTLGLDLDQRSGEFLGMDFIGHDPPRHELMRDVVKGPFGSEAVKSREAAIRARAEELAGRHEPGVPFNLANEFAHELPIATIAEMLGLPPGDIRELSHHLLVFLEHTPGELTVSPRSRAAARTIRDYVSQQGAERRAQPRDDLLTAIAQARIDGQPFTDEEFGALGFWLFVAGTDTVTGLITNALYWLHQNPDQLQLVINDPSLIPDAIEETLRYDPSLQHILRTTTREVELHGERMPSGTKVALSYGAANRDERRWDDPERFNIRREQKRNLAFAEGIHFCLGAYLARIEARVALEVLLARMPNYEILRTERIVKENQRGFRVFELVY